jgi:glutamyl-tRNA synthetase
MVEGILEGLRWLGLDWDEGPYFQSERGALYDSAVKRLLDEGHAYRDFSPPGESRAGESRELPETEVQQRLDSGTSFAVRFRALSGKQVSFEDLVFGRVVVETDDVEDFVILRSDGSPTYHLCVVVDDVDMGISHVIRGADHLSNTAKHVLLYKALGSEIPVYCHLPLILGTDKKRLSKRHGATSVTEYSQQGFLPAAVRNYLALLGWSPGSDDEILGEGELISRFDLRRINKANAIFDPSKLSWMNKRYLSAEPSEHLELKVRARLEENGLWDPGWQEADRDWFLGVVDLLKSRVEDLDDFAVYGRPFFTDDFEYDQEAVEKHLKPIGGKDEEEMKKGLLELRDEYHQLTPFDLEGTEEVLRRLAAKHELKTGAFIGAVRVATTGRAKAPGIFDVLIALGKEKSLVRLDRLIRFLE